MAVRDRPGSLLASLQPFAELGVSAHKLGPGRGGKPFEYVFCRPRGARRRARG